MVLINSEIIRSNRQKGKNDTMNVGSFNIVDKKKYNTLSAVMSKAKLSKKAQRKTSFNFCSFLVKTYSLMAKKLKKMKF